MHDAPLRFVFLTLPTAAEPTLNITIDQSHSRYRMSRDQLFLLNAQTADAMLRGYIREENVFRDPNQLQLDLGASA